VIDALFQCPYILLKNRYCDGKEQINAKKSSFHKVLGFIVDKDIQIFSDVYRIAIKLRHHSSVENMPVKYYAHPAFGDIALKKNKLSKGLRIIIRNTNSITVTFPWHLTYNDAIRFVKEKEIWISENLGKIDKIVGNRIFLPNQPFNTFAHELVFQKIDKGNPFIKVDRSFITIFYNEEDMLHTAAVQTHIQQAIEKVLRTEALKYLAPRTDFFADKFGLKYKSISVKKMKTRWGSCSSTGRLNFNIHLMRLPVHLIDYVILHELSHLKHHNHGPNFWKFLDELAGSSSKKLSVEMKKYRTTIY